MYRILTKPLIVLVALSVSFLAMADSEVIGTIEVTIDGNEQTWYVLQPEGDHLPMAFWMPIGPDERRVASIIAFENSDMDFTRDEATGISMPVNDAAVLTVTFWFPVGANEQSYVLPVTEDLAGASISVGSDWKDNMTLYNMTDSGQFHASTIDVDVDGTSRFAGTFTGTLTNQDSKTMTVTRGHFNVDGATLYVE